MKALTLIQPWATAIARWGKDVENRAWTPPQRILGQRIAIHAGKKFDAEACEWIEMHLEDEHVEELLSPSQPMPSSAVVATARLAGYVIEERRRSQAVAGCEDAVRAAFDSEWLVGPVGFVLADVVELPEPVPCRGAQGFWELPEDVAMRVLEQERLGRARPRVGA